MSDGLKLYGRYAVTRSTVCGDECPCAGAERVPYVRVDRRTTDDPMKNEYIGADWYRRGRNHRIENGRIARDFDDMRWEVNIPDEAAMMAFVCEHKQVIVSITNEGPTPGMKIEIYDGYRE